MEKNQGSDMLLLHGQISWDFLNTLSRGYIKNNIPIQHWFSPLKCISNGWKLKFWFLLHSSNGHNF
jgi:hypothetical protein